MALAIAAVAVAHLAPMVGFQPVVVSGRSMEPSIPSGSLVLLDARDPTEIAVGDVVTRRTASGTLVTHRVVRVAQIEGVAHFETRGDASGSADPVLAAPGEIAGTVALHLPVAGYVIAYLRQPTGILSVLGLLLTLLLAANLLDEIERDRGARWRTHRSGGGPPPNQRVHRVQPWRRPAGVLGVACLVAFLAGSGAQPSLALFTDTESVAGTFTTAASWDTVPPTVSSSVISKTVPYLAGYIRQGGTYYVYANVTDFGTPTSGVSTVTANVSTITTGQTAVALVAGSYSIGGVSYNYQSASLTADAALTAGSKSYTITATDVAGNSATTSGFSVTVDNTRPTGTDVQTTNAGVAGRPEIGDTITLTFSEVIDPQSVLAGWTGASTNVVVRVLNNAGGDLVRIRNAANTALLPLGTVDLIGLAYVSANVDFGATGTPSTMIAVGNTIVITLGTASGAVGTQVAANAMTWAPTTTLLDRAGNTCRTTLATEAAPLDLDF